MSKWREVGNWLKNNAPEGAALVGSLLSGNVPAAIAAGAALVTGATGTDDPEMALERLQSDPANLIKLRDLANAKEARLLEHAETMHAETQKTIRSGDNAIDKAVRMVRPGMAKQSWYSTIAYCAICLFVLIFDGRDLFNWEIAGFLSSPALAYFGLRTGDKIWGKSNQ